MQKAVSVIVPFYRVSAFIERCAESLMQQTLQEVEFLFVDDASPDDSKDRLEHVIAKHPGRDVRILTHAANKGLPAARNTGLAEACGEYVYHCDSDDYLEPDMLEKLYRAAKTQDADIAYCDFFITFEKGERYMANPEYSSSTDLLKFGYLCGRMKYNVWNKLVRRSLYVASGIVFPDGHNMGEDMTMIQLAAVAGKVASVPEALYHYVKLNPTAYSNTFSAKNLSDIRYNTDRTLAFLQGQEMPEKEKFLSLFKLNVKLPFLVSGDKMQYRLWKEWFPEADRFALSNPVLPFRTRLLQWAAAKGQFWYVRLYGVIIEKIYYGLRYK